MADLLHLLRLALGEVMHGRLPNTDSILKPLISKVRLEPGGACRRPRRAAPPPSASLPRAAR